MTTPIAGFDPEKIRETTPTAGFDIEKIKKHALIATIVGFVLGGAVPGVLGLLGYLKADQEPATAKKFVKWAWIAFVIIWVLAILAIIAYIIFIAVLFSNSPEMTTY